MNDTPRTDAEATVWRDAGRELVDATFARQLELELKSQGDRLAIWETGFETTNPAQAIAEHRAVLEKRTQLQREYAHLRDEVDRLLKSSQTNALRREHLEAQVKELNDEIAELRRPAPPTSEGDAPKEEPSA